MATTAVPDAPAQFPRLPPRLAAEHGDWTGALRLRAFPQTREDLDIDLDDAGTPRIVTAILARCALRADGEPVDPRFLWGLEVGARIECILRVAALSGPGSFALRVRCPNGGCGQALEFDLTLDELLSLRHEGDGPIVAKVGGAVRTLRAPTGEDQLALAADEFDDLEDAVRGLAVSLLEEPEHLPLSDADVEAIELSLTEYDPLVELSVRTACPHCGAEGEYEVDLTDLALGALREARDTLISDVHTLASRYHWTESEILSIPPRRRARYLALNERARSAG